MSTDRACDLFSYIHNTAVKHRFSIYNVRFKEKLNSVCNMSLLQQLLSVSFGLI